MTEQATSDFNRLLRTESLIDDMVAALESLHPTTLDLWQAKWLAAVRAYREAVTHD